MKIKIEWENIYYLEDDNALELMERTKVINGWLVRNVTITEKGRYESIGFIPDNDHKWEVELNYKIGM